MIITITGHKGFIGKNLKFNKDNTDVQNVDLKDGNDIVDMETVGDVVVHLAAVSSIPESFKDVEETARTNLYGLAHVIKLCQATKAKLIFASSSSAAAPASPYALSKAWGEELIKQSGIKYVILRFGNVYGEGDNKSAINAFKTGKKITIFGDGTQVRSFVYVKDVVKNIKAAINDNWGPGTYDVGGENLSVYEVATLFNKPITYGPRREGDVENLAMNPQLAIDTKLADWLANNA